MINNFDKLEKFLPLGEDTSHFNVANIIRRSKDFNDGEKHNKHIASYLVKSAGHLDELKPEITSLCEMHQARAYLSPEQKTFKRLQDQILVYLANANANGIVVNPFKMISSLADKTPTDGWKYFIIDIDDGSMTDAVLEALAKVYDYYDDEPITMNQTHSGVHFITRPFNVAKFNNILTENGVKDVEVKRHSQGTLLYYPDSLE